MIRSLATGNRRRKPPPGDIRKSRKARNLRAFLFSGAIQGQLSRIAKQGR